MKYGDLVTSDAHLPSARGPYMVAHVITKYAVCVSLDGDYSVNIPIDKCTPFPASKDVLEIVINAMKQTKGTT